MHNDVKLHLIDIENIKFEKNLINKELENLKLDYKLLEKE